MLETENLAEYHSRSFIVFRRKAVICSHIYGVTFLKTYLYLRKFTVLPWGLGNEVEKIQKVNEHMFTFVHKMRKKVYVRKSDLNILRSIKYQKDYRTWLKLFSCDYFLHNEYKHVNHKGHCMNYKLCNDIEKNPCPSIQYFVDPSKTIKAPYSQGNIMVFGENAGQQSLAMSLCFNISLHERHKYTQ